MLQQQKWRKKIEVKKLNRLFEQHREKGRFKPTIPHMVKSTPVVSPRPTSDSAEVKLKEEEQLTEMPGANMDTRAVHSHLKKQGWKLTRTSGSHDVFTHPNSNEHIPVPRHKQLKAPLVLSILRTSKMTNKPRNEEVEQIDEVSTPMLARYVKGAARDTAARGERYGKAALDKNLKRQRNIEKATEKIALRAMAKEEVEQIDEIHRSKMQGRLAMPLKDHPYHHKTDDELKYIQKDAHEAAQAMKGHSPKAEAKYLDQHNDASTVLYYRSRGGKRLMQKEETALQRIQRLRDKREDEAREREEDIFHKPKEKKQPARQIVQGHRYGGSRQKDDVNEEIEQIDELKKTTLLNYIGKATQRIGDRAAQSTLDYRRGEKEKGRESQRKEMKHATGVVRAASRLATGRTTNEEVESIGAHADKLKKYADEHGGIDKQAFHTAANLMKKGDHEALKKHVRSMDTDPRDKVLDHIHPHHFKSLGFSPIGSMESAVKRHNKMHSINESLYEDEREYDYEGEMLKSDLRSIMANAQRITDMLEDNDNLPEWCQSKITLAEDYVSTVANYLTAEMNEETEYLEEKNAPTNPELWARAKSLAKSKFDVYPSAYANGWASKWYKEKGGGWKSVSEEVEQIDELSKGTLRSYAAKAIDSTRTMPGTGSRDEGSKKSKRMASVMLAAKKLNREEVEQIDEVHAPGTKVKVPHNGKMVSGKVVRHDKGDAHGTPFYVVDVGDYESKKVSAHNVQKEETEPPFTSTKPKKDVVVGKKGEGMAKVRHLARMAMQKQMKKPVKEEKQISKKAQIVKSAMKKMPDEDKFQKDPELGNTLTKNV